MSTPNPAPSLPPGAVLYQMAIGHYFSRALYLAAKLGVADLLAAGPRDAAALAKTPTRTSPRSPRPALARQRRRVRRERRRPLRAHTASARCCARTCPARRAHRSCCSRASASRTAGRSSSTACAPAAGVPQALARRRPVRADGDGPRVGGRCSTRPWRPSPGDRGWRSRPPTTSRASRRSSTSAAATARS